MSRCAACKGQEGQFYSYRPAPQLQLCETCFVYAGQPMSLVDFPPEILMNIFMELSTDLPALRSLVAAHPYLREVVAQSKEFWGKLRVDSLSNQARIAYDQGEFMEAVRLTWNEVHENIGGLMGVALFTPFSSQELASGTYRDFVYLTMITQFLGKGHLSPAILVVALLRDSTDADPSILRRWLTQALTRGLYILAMRFRNRNPGARIWDDAHMLTVDWIIAEAQQLTFMHTSIDIGIAEFQDYFKAIYEMLDYTDDIASNVILLRRLLNGLSKPDFQLGMGYVSTFMKDIVIESRTNMTSRLLRTVANAGAITPKGFQRTVWELLRVMPIPTEMSLMAEFPAMLPGILMGSTTGFPNLHGSRVLEILLQDERITKLHIHGFQVDEEKYPELAELLRKIRAD